MNSASDKFAFSGTTGSIVVFNNKRLSKLNNYANLLLRMNLLSY